MHAIKLIGERSKYEKQIAHLREKLVNTESLAQRLSQSETREEVLRKELLEANKKIAELNNQNDTLRRDIEFNQVEKLDSLKNQIRYAQQLSDLSESYHSLLKKKVVTVPRVIKPSGSSILQTNDSVRIHTAQNMIRKKLSNEPQNHLNTGDFTIDEKQTNQVSQIYEDQNSTNRQNRSGKLSLSNSTNWKRPMTAMTHFTSGKETLKTDAEDGSRLGLGNGKEINERLQISQNQLKEETKEEKRQGKEIQSRMRDDPNSREMSEVEKVNKSRITSSSSMNKSKSVNTLATMKDRQEITIPPLLINPIPEVDSGKKRQRESRDRKEKRKNKSKSKNYDFKTSGVIRKSYVIKSEQNN